MGEAQTISVIKESKSYELKNLHDFITKCCSYLTYSLWYEET